MGYLGQRRVYEWRMTRSDSPHTREKLIRVTTVRRGSKVDLRVHYEISREHGCETYRIIQIEELK